MRHRVISRVLLISCSVLALLLVVVGCRGASREEKERFIQEARAINEALLKEFGKYALKSKTPQELAEEEWRREMDDNEWRSLYSEYVDRFTDLGNACRASAEKLRALKPVKEYEEGLRAYVEYLEALADYYSAGVRMYLYCLETGKRRGWETLGDESYAAIEADFGEAVERSMEVPREVYLEFLQVIGSEPVI